MLFFARQPIFTVRGTLYGYELLFRDQSNLAAANIQDGSQATSEIIVDGISFASAHSGARTKVFINIPDELLRSEILESLSPDMCILEILETVPCTRENIAVLRHLKSLGYTLALDDYKGQRGGRVSRLVDIVKGGLPELRPPGAGQASPKACASAASRCWRKKWKAIRRRNGPGMRGTSCFRALIFSAPS